MIRRGTRRLGVARVAAVAAVAGGLLAVPMVGSVGTDSIAPVGQAAVAAGPLAVRVRLADRSYLLVEPPDGAAGLPVVLALHGRTDSAQAFLDRTGLGALAADGQAVVVAPLTAPWVSAGGAPTAWNAGSCCDGAAGSALDDTGFLAAVVTDVSARTGADAGTVVLAGFSNGAMLGYRVACTRPELLDGLVAVAGTRLPGHCQPSPGLRLVHLHGGDDAAVPVGGLAWSPLLRTALRPVADAVRPFAASGSTVQVRVLRGQGHGWPGPGDAVDATQVVRDLLDSLAVKPAAPPPPPPSR